MARHLRWLIILPALCFALWPQFASADPQPGLDAVGYTFNPNNGFPTRSDDLYPTCGSEIENNINRNFNGEPFANCGWDFFMVHYTGFITIPENSTVQMMVAADDGGTVKVGLTEFGTWNLKGCTWSQQVSITESGSLPLDGWFFEWGGGTCYMLAWRINNGPWEIVPDSAFTRTETPTTTTEPPTTTTEATTTTTEPVTTTTEQPTTTTEATTTTVETTTTTSTTTTTVYVPPATTTTTTEPPTTTTTTTVPETTTTLPPTTVPPPPTTVEPSTTTTYTSTTTTHTTVPPTTTTPETQTTQAPTTTQAPPPPTTPETTSLPQATLPPDPTPQQITAIIETVTVEQATEVFAELEVSELDEEQVAALVAAVQTAPTEIREAFEQQVDIFKEGLDDYVPVGSNIPVGTRRTLVAAGAAIAVAGASSRMRKQ